MKQLVKGEVLTILVFISLEHVVPYSGLEEVLRPPLNKYTVYIYIYINLIGQFLT